MGQLRRKIEAGRDSGSWSLQTVRKLVEPSALCRQKPPGSVAAVLTVGFLSDKNCGVSQNGLSGPQWLRQG